MSLGKERKVTAFILTLTLLFITALPAGNAFGAQKDITGHWAEGVIQKALATGYVSGYPDGTIRPDDRVTRAEFVTMVNGALGLREENVVNLLFEDVAETEWYYDEVQKASYVQYIKGTSDASFAPEAFITRQEAATMLSRFLPKDGFSDNPISGAFRDQAQIATWAYESLAVVTNKGYIKGYDSGLLSPTGTLTRAEAVTILESILKKETIIREDVSVQIAGEILQDTIYVGDISIESSVGNGDVDFSNLSALSKVYVYGGGTNTVKVQDSLIIEMIVGKVGSAVRVQATGNSDVKRSYVLGNNLLVNEIGEPAEPGVGAYEEIVKIQGTTNLSAFAQHVSAISHTVDNTGKMEAGKLSLALDGIKSLASTTWNSDKSYTVIFPSRRGSSTTSVVQDPEDSETPSGGETVSYGTLSLSTIDFCGISHGGIGANSGAFTTIASITTNGETTTAYAIYTPAQLQHLALHLNANAILMNDLDFSTITVGAIGAADPSTPLGALSAAALAIGENTATNLRISSFTAGKFTPIGTSSSQYTGTFYGNNKIITGLTISGSTVDYVGIFGYASGAAIKDLTTSGGAISGINNVGGVVGYSENSTVRGSNNAGTVTGSKNSVGGVVGLNIFGSMVSTSYNTGKVIGTGTGGLEGIGGVVGRNSNGSTVSDSHNTGAVSGGGRCVGGVVGLNISNSMVSTSYNTGAVKENGSGAIGGVVGNNNAGSTISAVYNTGSVSGTHNVGGVVGYIENSRVRDSYNTGAVTGTGSYVGGVVGYNYNGSTISAVYNTGAVSGIDRVGGVVGSSLSSTVSDSYSTGAVTGTGNYVGGVLGYNDNGSTVNGSWLEGTNLTSSALGVGSKAANATGTTTTFSGITGDGTTLSAIYTSMGAIATSAGGVTTGAITAISFSGVDTPPQFHVLQGAYINSASSLTITVSAVSGTTLTVTTASSLAALLTPGGVAVTGTAIGGNTSFVPTITSSTWILIKAVNTNAKLNRDYFVYVKLENQ